MEKIKVEEVESSISPAKVKREISDHLGAKNVAINFFSLEPGDDVGFGYHAHEKQEEIFYVQSGTITFETEKGDIEVNEGEIIRFSPGEYQLGKNRSDETADLIALGAPKDNVHPLEVLRECPNCGKRTPQDFDFSKERVITSCEECGEQTGRYTPRD